MNLRQIITIKNLKKKQKRIERINNTRYKANMRATQNND